MHHVAFNPSFAQELQNERAMLDEFERTKQTRPLSPDEHAERTQILLNVKLRESNMRHRIAKVVSN